MIKKPPYIIPSMKEIAAIEKNGFKGISFFSGCGGSCLGFKMAGFQILWANEFIKAAQETYAANHSETHLNCSDIRSVNPQSILDYLKMQPGDLDFIEGSPPCASFSTSGVRSAAWGKVKKYSDSKQRTDDLFFEFARMIKALQPKVFIAENVSGLIKGVAKGYFKEILAALKDCGYRVQAKLLDAQWLGVPQMRQRIIFCGVREDLSIEPLFPLPFAYRYSIAEVLFNGDSGLRAVHDTSGIHSEGDVTDKPCPTVIAQGRHLFIEKESSISGCAIDREYGKLARGQKGRYHNFIKPLLNRPSPTLTAAGGSRGTSSVVHPTDRRKFSIAELKIICSFPEDFILTGSYAQQWERLGRAVPPLMMKAIAECVKEMLLNNARIALADTLGSQLIKDICAE